MASRERWKKDPGCGPCMHTNLRLTEEEGVYGCIECGEHVTTLDLPMRVVLVGTLTVLAIGTGIAVIVLLARC